MRLRLQPVECCICVAGNALLGGTRVRVWGAAPAHELQHGARGVVLIPDGRSLEIVARGEAGGALAASCVGVAQRQHGHAVVRYCEGSEPLTRQGRPLSAVADRGGNPDELEVVGAAEGLWHTMRVTF